MSRIYLDHNASTPIDPRVLDSMIQQLKSDVGNPSSIHSHGREARRQLDQSRRVIADYFDLKPREIIFNSGGAEGASFLINGYLEKVNRGHVITSAVEHSCVHQTLKEWEHYGIEISYLSPGERGAVSADQVRDAIRDDTCLIVLIAVNNETGVVTDVAEIAHLAEQRSTPFIVDGVSWLGKEMIHIPKGVSAAFFSAHKINAPKGVGFCISRQTFKIIPQIRGGEQEFQKRGGTENLSGIVAMAKAIEILEEEGAENIHHMREIRQFFETELKKRVPKVLVNGSGNRTCNVSNLAFPGIDGETLLMLLDEAGISVSHGSACSSGALQPSRILLEMGYPIERVRSSIRFSFGKKTSYEEIEKCLEKITEIIYQLDKFNSP